MEGKSEYTPQTGLYKFTMKILSWAVLFSVQNCSDAFDYIEKRGRQENKTQYTSVAHPNLSPLHIQDILTLKLLPLLLQ